MLFQAKEPCVVWGNQSSCPKDISPKIRLSKTRVILTEMLIYVVQSFNILRDITLVLFDITSVENDFQATWQYTGTSGLSFLLRLFREGIVDLTKGS